jgi:hypothetical protein
VVLYGQHLSRIARLERTRVDVTQAPPRIKLGRNWLDLPEPVGKYLNELLNAKPARTTPFDGDPQWLFPGATPGDHIAEDALSRRLQRYGIRARPMRNTALFQIAATVQPTTLARLLGLHNNSAVDWINAAGGAYATYWRNILEDESADDLDLVDLEVGDDAEEDPVEFLEGLGIL